MSDQAGTAVPQWSDEELAAWAIPDPSLVIDTVDDVLALGSFQTVLRSIEQRIGLRFGQLPLATQDAVINRRLSQLLATMRVNPIWRERLAGVPHRIASAADWAAVPLTDKHAATAMFTGHRPGMVVPINAGGFQVVASGGTSSGMPSETVYELSELARTYIEAGAFIGRHMLDAHMGSDRPRWLTTTLADYQMWSSGTMVGGVLAAVPGFNYVGAGPMSPEVYCHLMEYPGPKAIMGISASIARLPEMGVALGPVARASLRVAMYGSGQLSHQARANLHAAYPDITVLSYFAATQAEAIGLQLSGDSPALATIPGLHLVEVVGPDGRQVAIGETGELVVTRLLANHAPVLRYQVGDRVVRLPNLTAPSLNTTQFEFVGRSSDILHIADTQYAAAPALAGIFQQFRKRVGLDLQAHAAEVQFVNNRRTRELVLVIACPDAEALRAQLASRLGPAGSAPVIAAGLLLGLSVFNTLEADEAALARTGYFFGTRIVAVDCPELERTAVGKVPLLVDRI